MADLSSVWQDTESLVEELKFAVQLMLLARNEPKLEVKTSQDMQKILQQIQGNCARARALSEAQERAFSQYAAQPQQQQQQRAAAAQQPRAAAQQQQQQRQQQQQVTVHQQRPQTVIVNPAMAGAYLQQAAAATTMFNPLLNPYGAVLQQPLMLQPAGGIATMGASAMAAAAAQHQAAAAAAAAQQQQRPTR